MAGNVDNRVVQLTFKNRQFERNIAKSKKSLDELKASMNFDETSKGLNKFAEGMDKLSFSHLEDNIQKLTDKFTGLGTATELVVSQIRRKIEEAARAVSGFIDSMTTQQVGVGKDKYDMLNKSVRTIMNATGKDEKEVLAVMERLNKYTDQTSYDFADMAQNIGKFTSVGIPLEKAEKQMEGIANWAAQSGAGIAEASRAMYNLSQAMGAGKLMKIDWKSIENAGMATKEYKEQMIEAGIAAGTLKKKGDKVFTKKGNMEVTYKNFAETLAKGWATSEVLGSTLERYYWDDLKYESEEAFEKMLENDKKISQQEWEILKEKKYVNEESIKAALEAGVAEKKLTKETLKNGKEVYKILDQNGKEIKITAENFEESLDLGWFDEKVYEKAEDSIGGLAKTAFQSAQKCLTFSDVMQAWKDQISTGWMNAYRMLFGDLAESMEFFSGICDKVGESFGNLIDFFVKNDPTDPRKGILTIWASLGGRKGLFQTILGGYGDDAEEGAYGLIDVIQNCGKLIKDAFWDLVDIFLPANMRSIWNEDWFIERGGREAFLGGALKQFTDNIQNAIRNVHAFFNEQIQVGDGTKSRMELIRDTIMVFAAAVRVAYDLVYGVIGFFSNVAAQLQPTFDAILGFLSTLGITIYETADASGQAKTIPQFFQDLADTLKPVTSGINFVVEKLTSLLNVFLTSGGATTAATTFFGTVGTYIKRFFDYVSRIGGSAITFLGEMIGILKDLFSGGFGEENLKKTGEAIKTAFKNMFDSLPDGVKKIARFFKTLYKNIKNVIKNRFSKESTEKLATEVKAAVGGIVEKLPEGLKENGKTVLEKIKEFFKDLWEKITAFFKGDQAAKDGEPKQSIFDRVKDWLVGGYTKIKTYIQEMVGNLKGDAASFGTAVKNLNWSKILLYLFGGLAAAGIATLIAKVFGVVKTLGKALKLIGDILTGEKAIAPKLFKLEEKSSDFGTKLLKIAAAFAVFAAAIILIGNMELPKAIQGMVAVTLILGMLVAASFFLKKAYKDVKWEEAVGMFAGLIGMGIAIAAVAKAILPIADIGWDGFIRIVGTLVTIFAGLIILSRMAANGNMSLKNMGGILGVAAGIAILVFALKRIADAKPEQIHTMLGVLLAILIELFGFVFVVSKTNSSLADKQLGQLAAVAGAIAILIIALKRVANMELEQLGKMMAVLTGVLGEFVAFVKLTQKNDMSGKGLAQLAALAGAIAILMFALLPLSLLQWDQLARGVVAVSFILAELTLVAKTISKNGVSASGSGLAQLIGLAGAVVLISLALLPLALIEFNKLKGALIAVSAIIVLLAGVIFAASKSKDADWKAMASLLAVAGAIALLVLALTPLAMIDEGGLAKMGGALAAIAVALMLMLSKVGKVKASAVLATSLLMAVMTAVILAMGAAMHDIKDIDWKVIAAFAGGLAVMIGLIGFAIDKLAHVNLAQGLKAILLLAAAVAALGLVFSFIGPMIINSFGNALTDLAANLNFFATLISEFTSKMSSANSNGGIGNAESVINRLKNLMASLSDFASYSWTIGLFQTALFQLGSGVSMFYDMTKDVGSLENNATFALIQGLAGCAKDLDTITKLPIRTLQDQIAGLGGAMSIYAEGVKSAGDSGGFNFKEDEIPDVTKAVTLMQEITKAFNSDNAHFEIPENMPEEEELTHFGVQLAALAGGMVKFEQAGRNIGDPDSSNAVKTLTFFKDLQQELINQKDQLDFGAVKEFTDEMEKAKVTPSVLTQFGTDISGIAEAMKLFHDATTTTNEVTKETEPIDFSKATNALESFVKIKDQLPEVGGVVQWFAGEKQSLTDLGTEISAAALALSELSTTMMGGEFGGKTYTAFNSESTTKAVNALGEWVTGINNITGKLTEFSEVDIETGENIYGLTDKHTAIMELAEEIGAVGQGLNTLSDNIQGNSEKGIQSFNPDVIEPAIESLGKMSNFISQVKANLPRVGGLDGIIKTLKEGREGNMKDLKDEMGWLGEGLNELSAKIGDNLNVTGISSAIDSLKSFAEIMATMSTINEDKIFDGYDMIYRLNDFITGFLGEDAFGDQLVNKGAEVKPLENLVLAMHNLSELITQNGVDKNAIEMFLDMSTALNQLSHTDTNFDFTDVGLNMANGIVEGMKKGEVLVMDEASNLVLVAKDAAKAAGIIKSPSQLFAGLGQYLSMGLAQGIEDKVGMVKSASEDAVYDSFTTMSQTLGIIDKVLAEGLETDPVITPVLNMDQVRSEIEAFNRGYGMSQIQVGTSVNHATQVGNREGDVRQPIETKTNFSGVYERMNAMTQEIADMGRKILQMKLVLDTGVLAGGVTDGVDSNLARNQFYAGRNN